MMKRYKYKFEIGLYQDPKGDYVKYKDVPGWVSVEERLPGPDPRISDYFVALVVNDGNVQWGMYVRSAKEWVDAGYRNITSQVTHWQPLPEPPGDDDD